MTVVLLSVSVMLRQAARIHDETETTMNLHETMEKRYHEGMWGLEASVSRAQRYMDRLMFFTDCNLMIKEKGQRIYGISKDGKWKREIEAGGSRPEIFLRGTILIGGLAKEDGD